MKATKLIVAFTAVMLIATGAYSQWRPMEPIRPILPAPPTIQQVPAYSAAPSYSVAPSSVDAPSERAKAEDAKLRNVASARIFAYKRVILADITRVTAWDDGKTYSVKAFFNIQGESVALRCSSTVKAAVEAFLEYIKTIFQNDSSTDRSLEMIVADAHRYLRDVRGFSDDQITFTYIDQFIETHVVQVSRHRLELTLASRGDSIYGPSVN
jgi:hypothetical protein